MTLNPYTWRDGVKEKIKEVIQKEGKICVEYKVLRFDGIESLHLARRRGRSTGK